MVGRQRERAELAAALAGARDGRGRAGGAAAGRGGHGQVDARRLDGWVRCRRRVAYRVDALSPRPPQRTSSRGLGRRAGPVWVFDGHGGRSTVPDSKGVRDLAVLLARPGQALPAFDLVEAAGGPPAAAAAAQSDLGPVLDDTARRAYRDRLRELDGELAEAEADADLGRLELLRAERSMLADELAGALGLGGRVRVTGDPAERARKAVTMRIRAAVKTIGTRDEALARHLANAVRTGRLCSYEPEPGVSWQVSWQS